MIKYRILKNRLGYNLQMECDVYKYKLFKGVVKTGQKEWRFLDTFGLPYSERYNRFINIPMMTPFKTLEDAVKEYKTQITKTEIIELPLKQD
jgi:hypothetical protein